MVARTGGAVMRAVRTAVAEATDRELLARFADGDEAAFAALVGRHGGLVLGVCRRVLPTVQDAEDATQAVFLVLAKKAGGRWQSSIANWLYTTARRIAAKANRTARRRTKREARPAPPDAPSALDQMTGREAFAALDDELDRLPPIYREPLVLCHLQGLTRDEAAARLGVPAATVKTRLERGRKRLADALTNRGIVLGAGFLAVAATSPAGASPPALTTAVLAAVHGSPSAAVAALAQGVAMNGILSRLKLAAVAGLLAVVGLVTASPADQPKPAEKMDKPKVTVKSDAKKPDEKERVVTGTVLGVDGKPAAGVKLFSPRTKVFPPRSEEDLETVEVGKTDAAGKFRVTIRSIEGLAYLVAHAAGAGVDWAENPTGDVTLRLVPDAPITGRVVSSEGKPLAGVKASVAMVFVPKNNDFDAYLKVWQSAPDDALSSASSLDKQLYFPLDAIAGGAVTDADGKFKLTGAGKDRVAAVRFQGAGIARTQPVVFTRPGLDVKPYTEEMLKKNDSLRVLNRFYGPFPLDMTFVAEPGRTVTGTVTDPAGKPVAGATVSTSTSWGDGVQATTDAAGKYRLDGVAKKPGGYPVHVEPPKDSGLLGRNAHSPDSEGVGPVTVDAKLTKGVYLSGRVIDKQTGKGVKGSVRLAPLPGNKFYGTPGMDSYRTDRTSKPTDADGRFRIPTIPGQAVVMAQVFSGEKFDGQHLNPYRSAQPDPDHKDLFQLDPSAGWMVAVPGGLDFISTEQAVKVVDLKETGETTVELVVDRGATAKLEVRGPDGKPLAGAYLSGMTDAWPVVFKLPESAATIYALDPAAPRTVAVLHPTKKLAGLATVRGDEKEPVVVTLAATATVTGRFLDEDGKPLVGAEVTAEWPGRPLSELYRFTVKERPKAVTDEKGNFTLPAVVPGEKFYLLTRKGERYYAGKPKLGLLTLKAGETKELGDRTLEVAR